LTSTPVWRRFDPSLRTAVHIDGSQNAVAAVLLQWQENEDNPGPVAFMSRKLSGAQYRYDARNFEGPRSTDGTDHMAYIAFGCEV